MSERFQVYECKHCGVMVEVVRGAGGTLVCCGSEMSLLEENTTEAAVEKHVPVAETTAEGITVAVGSVHHPMEEKHLIEWIEVIQGDRAIRHHLGAGAPPTATFKLSGDVDKIRAFCNLHGLWKL